MNKPKLHHFIISMLCLNMLPAQAQTPDIPLGSIGGTCELLPGTGYIRVNTLIANAPGARANLQVGDLINAAYGFAFEATSTDKQNGYLGALQERRLLAPESLPPGSRIASNRGTLIPGEGAAALVLEREPDARSRGRTPYATISAARFS